MRRPPRTQNDRFRPFCSRPLERLRSGTDRLSLALRPMDGRRLPRNGARTRTSSGRRSSTSPARSAPLLSSAMCWSTALRTRISVAGVPSGSATPFILVTGWSRKGNRCAFGGWRTAVGYARSRFQTKWRCRYVVRPRFLVGMMFFRESRPPCRANRCKHACPARSRTRWATRGTADDRARRVGSCRPCADLVSALTCRSMRPSGHQFAAFQSLSGLR